MANRSEVSAAGADQRKDRAGSFSFRAPGPEDRFATACLIGFATIFAALLAFTQKLLGDGDSGWHVAAGRHIIATGSVPMTDPFSFSASGRAWHAHEWLAEVLMAAVFNGGGWHGLLLPFAIAFGLILLLIGRELVRWIAVRWAICVLVVLSVLLIPLAFARPHVLSWLLLAGWMLILLHAREQRRAPSFAAVPLILVWANLHASYIFGLGLAGLFALEALVDQRRDGAIITRWATFIVTAGLAACVTPYGVQGLLYPFQVSGMQALGVIREWQATNFEEHWPFIAVDAALWGLVMLRWRRLHPIRILLLAGLTVVAAAHVRHQTLLIIVAATMIGPLLAGDSAPILRPEKESPRARWMAVAASAGLFITLWAAIPFEMKDNSAFPNRAISHVPAPLRAQPVFNDYSFGGPLILAGIRPYIDGRADMYGDEFTLDYMAMNRGDIDRFRRADRRWHFGWTILPPNIGLVAKLDREPGWRRLFADQWAVVHVRASQVNPGCHNQSCDHEQ